MLCRPRVYTRVTPRGHTSQTQGELCNLGLELTLGRHTVFFYDNIHTMQDQDESDYAQEFLLIALNILYLASTTSTVPIQKHLFRLNSYPALRLPIRLPTLQVSQSLSVYPAKVVQQCLPTQQVGWYVSSYPAGWLAFVCCLAFRLVSFVCLPQLVTYPLDRLALSAYPPGWLAFSAYPAGRLALSALEFSPQLPLIFYKVNFLTISNHG